jgi:hypothetical protein
VSGELETWHVDPDILYGSIEIVRTEWRDGEDLVLGGYSIHRGRYGQETKRTANRENCRLKGYYDPRCWR